MDWINKHQLYCKIHYAIETCITGLPSKHEPDYIAALVTSLPSQLSNVLGRQYNVGGCFIHQKPCAKFCNPALQHYKSPEIGDLPIVTKKITLKENYTTHCYYRQKRRVIFTIQQYLQEILIN